jgi:recombination protein RecA
MAPPWQALDQALRATDLLLQAGGFTLVVLDLGNVLPEVAWKIPMTTWFRFRAACDRTRVSLLLLTQHSCARSSAEAVVRMQLGNIESQGNLMTGIHFQAATQRSRISGAEERVVPIRKPPQPERMGVKKDVQWTSEAAWMEAG